MRAAALVLVLLAACSGRGQPDPIPKTLTFRTLGSSRNLNGCVDGPEFGVAFDEDAWIDLYDRHTACTDDATFRLPRIRFPREAVVVAWWGTEPCPGRVLAIRSVVRTGETIVVSAASKPARARCAGDVAVQSLLAVRGAAGAIAIEFSLDGMRMGSIRDPSVSHSD